MGYDVFGMCNALYDIQAEVSEEVLADVGMAKGGMFLIDEAQQRALATKVYSYIVNSESGGSGANTMIGLAQLGGSGCYTSRVANDEHGALYTAKLRERGVEASLGQGSGVTGICLVLVTPDAERTLCTFLGSARDLQPSDVALDALKQSQYLYVTGYLWDTDNQKEAVLLAMRTAKEAGVKVAFCLSDPFCVNRHKADFLNILRDYVDVVIGNDSEAMALTDTATPHDAIRALTPHTVAVTMGGNGSLVRQGETVLEIPSVRITPVDTTGAGDMYSAGILYGLTHGLNLEQTGRLASYMAAQVVAKMGPRLDMAELDNDAIATLKS